MERRTVKANTRASRENVDAAKECTVFCGCLAILFPPSQRASAMVATSVGVRRCICRASRLWALLTVLIPCAASGAAPTEQTHFEQRVRPFLKSYCFDCHGGGSKEGNLSLDQF